MKYHILENEIQIDELYVVLSSDENGEGIVSIITSMGSMPMVFRNPKMLDQAKKIINQMSKDTGRTIKIYKFKKI